MTVNQDKVVFDTQFDGINVLVTSKIEMSDEANIEAHFLTGFIALVLQRLLQFKTDYQWSCRKLKIALNSAQAHEIGQGYWCVECNEEFKAITKCLNIKWDYAYVKHEQLNVFGKGWFTT